MGKITHNRIHITRNHRLYGWKLLTVLTLFICAGLLVVFNTSHSNAKEPNPEPLYLVAKGIGNNSIQNPHLLPLSLEKWQDKTNSGDYFDHIQPTPVGYLIWSQFPVKVKISTPTGIGKQELQTWLNHVVQSVQEWSVYLPLEVVENSEIADITILRKSPPLEIQPGSKVIRARSALTTYELFYQNDVLSHRFTILLNPSQTGEYLQAAARHEIGHALGIWGHSPLQTDALYFSQVSKPASISSRDVNTLKRIYQQSTSLGWSKRMF